MGRTPKPLIIVALAPCASWDELRELEQKGHVVIRVARDEVIQGNIFLDADLVIGDRCWRLTQHHRKYLPLAIKTARMLRYNSHEERARIHNHDLVDDELGIEPEGGPDEDN